MHPSYCKALEIILTGKHIQKDYKKHNQGKGFSHYLAFICV